MAIRMNQEEQGCFLLVMGIGAVLFGVIGIIGQGFVGNAVYILGGGILAICLSLYNRNKRSF